MTTWQFQPIFGSYLLVAALALAMLLVLLIGPTFGQLSKARQRTLLMLRLGLILLMAVSMLRPTQITTEKKIQTSQILLLADTSRSMNYRDGEGGGTRWDDQLAILNKAKAQLGDMGEHFQVELIGFSDGIQPQENLKLAAKPVGEETDLGEAIESAVQRHLGKRLAAVILISDGAQRALAPRAPPQNAARQLDRRATPLYTIGLGRSLDQSQSRDVAIENMQDEYSVFVNNEFALRVGVRIQGYLRQPIPVTLIVENEQGQRETAGTVELMAESDSQIAMGDFTYRPQEPGQYRLYVEAKPQPGEITDNNSMTAFLNVREGGLRVLLLTSAQLLEEAKFLRRSLDESPDIELDSRIISVLTEDNWPLDLETQLVLEEYDVFLIGDMDATALHPRNWSRITKLVEAGRGLMMYGGYHSFSPGGYADTSLAEILPIKMQRLYREPEPTSFSRNDRHIKGPIRMVPTKDSSITHIAPDSENRLAWQELQPLKGANLLAELKDGSVVLAETQDGKPLLVQSLSARVLALATDSTHVWRRYGRADAHKKFWRQAILWLARRDKLQANTAFIDMPQRRFREKSRVIFRTGLTDEVGDLVPDTDMVSTITFPDKSTVPIALTNATDGTRGVVANTDQPGIYRIESKAMVDGNVVASSYADFVVVKEDFELSDPAANPGLLDMLAKMTARVGGKAIAPEQLAGLLKQIKDTPPKDEIETQSKWQLGDTSIDAWTFFLLLVLLLSAEWFLRKKWGLV